MIAFALKDFDKKDTRSVEEAWLDVEAGVQLLVARAMKLQTARGASRESSLATTKLREALMWLAQRRQLPQPAVRDDKP